jgi:hypothetical protein
LAALRIGGAHLNSVAPSGISSAANHRYCTQVSTVMGTPRAPAASSGNACALDKMHNVDGRLELFGQPDEQLNGVNLGSVGRDAR